MAKNKDFFTNIKIFLLKLNFLLELRFFARIIFLLFAVLSLKSSIQVFFLGLFQKNLTFGLWFMPI